MTRRYPTVLTVSGRVLDGLTVLNLVYGAGLLLLFVASLLQSERIFVALARMPVDPDAVRAMRLLMLVGLAAVPITHVLLRRLRAIVETVRGGDPFVVENARRLNTIAVALLGLELLHQVVGIIARSGALFGRGIRIGWSFSFTPWVAVLLLFVLARVFEHGAEMRADLEGTV